MMFRQRGSVIIIVLWTSVLLTVLVTVMAGKVQLAAKTAFHNQAAVTDLARVASAMNQAEMELMLERMSAPIDRVVELDADGNFRDPLYRFNGRPLTLYYPTDEDMVVRIFDHAGKINLNGIRPAQLQLLIEKRLGPDPDYQQVQDLLTAWVDWTDLNDAEGINGADKDYYASLDPPFTPRNNGELDSVEELRLIRGFDELFKDVNLDAAFTIYGNGQNVNLNFATREAMQLLPGLTDEYIEEIIAYREQHDFRSKQEVGDLLPTENFVELSNWIGFTYTSYFSIFAYPKPVVEDADVDADNAQDEVLDTVTQAYMEIVEVRGYADRARVYKVDPYGRLPDTRPAQVED